MPSDCSALPIHAADTTAPCAGYNCPDMSVNPPTYSCKKMRYIFSPSFIQKGFILKGASGAYVPAITMCQRNLNPIKLSEVSKSPSNNLVALPESQTVTFQ